MTDTDPFIDELRDQISDNDRKLLDALNTRLTLVAELKRYKEEHGIEFLDPDRERTILDDLARANAGPLSDEGLRDFVTEVLALTKRELR